MGVALCQLTVAMILLLTLFPIVAQFSEL